MGDTFYENTIKNSEKINYFDNQVFSNFDISIILKLFYIEWMKQIANYVNTIRGIFSTKTQKSSKLSKIKPKKWIGNINLDL